jgi:hypothetical protein
LGLSVIAIFMIGDTLSPLVRRFTALGGEAARAAHDDFEADLRALLATPPSAVRDRAAWARAIRHAHAYYAWSWDPRAKALVPAITSALEVWATEPKPDVPALLELLDLLYFVGWCFEASNLAQCRLVLQGMQAAARALARLGKAPRAPRKGRPRIVFLLMFTGLKDVMALGPRLLMDALRRMSGAPEIHVVAWRFVDDLHIRQMREQGIRVTSTGGETPAERLVQIEAALAKIKPDILITEMNNAVPIAVFARRNAPAQLFLQGGLPAFPQPGLDAVFDSFGIGADHTGWGAARILPFRPAWDLAMLLPEPDMAQIETERATMAPGDGPLFGVYGRLVKVTPEYLKAVEAILQAVPDARFVTGGTGDPAPIEAFARASPVGDRMQVQARFVPGHCWGHLLDLFLDTWPLTGGESVRETMAKGCPVISLHSPEMPAMDWQREPSCIARDWDQFHNLSIHLLRDAAARRAAGEAAAAFAQRMAESTSFDSDVQVAVDTLMAHAPRPRPSFFTRLFGEHR